MNEQIKQRIIQLNNGEVPSGYIKTDFGVFPSDWITDKMLKDLGSFDKGKGLPGDKMTTEGIPCVGYGDIYMKYNHFHFEQAQTFVDEETAFESQPIRKGTLLFTGTGETAEEIGKCVCYNGDETIYAGGDIITFVGAEVNPLFLAYQQYQGFSLRKKASLGQGHSVVHIQQKDLEKLNVAYPKSTEEQSKIAEILMKWDEVIELQERYNAILALKQKVVIAKVLSSVKGVSKPLSDCVEYYPSNLLIKDLSYVEGGYPVYGATGISTYIDSYCFDCKTVAIIKYGSSAGKVVLLDGKHSVLGTMAEMIAKEGVDIQYIYYLLKVFSFKRFIEISTTPNVYFEDYSKEKIIIPSYEKQKEIVDILNSFEKILKANESKLELLRKQRKALQQYLLNGIVRV